MNKPPEDDSSPAPTAEQLDRIASLATQTLIEVRRAARVRDADLQLNAREKMALRDMLERVERAIKRANASPSLTVVQDVPVAIEAEKSGRGDEISVVNLRLPWAPKKLVPVPNRLVRRLIAATLSLGSGGVIHALHHWHVLQ